jgi:hypothetical protein
VGIVVDAIIWWILLFYFFILKILHRLAEEMAQFCSILRGDQQHYALLPFHW